MRLRARIHASILCLLLLVGGAGLTGCGNRPAPGTPAAPAAVSKAYQIRQGLLAALTVVETTQESTIALYRAGKISQDNSRTIVTWTVAAAKGIKAATVTMSSNRPLPEKIAAVRLTIESIGKTPAISGAASLLATAEAAINSVWRLL